MIDRRHWPIILALLTATVCACGCRTLPKANGANDRYEALVTATETLDIPAEDLDDVELLVCNCTNGGPCECEAAGHACVCGPKPAHQVFRRFEPQTLLLFTEPGCAPCVPAKAYVKTLQAAGWPVHVIDCKDDPEAAAACEIDRVPTWVCVRGGVECGRHIGKDRAELRAMLKRANRLKFPERIE